MRTFSEKNHSKFFLDQSQAKETKEKVKKWDLIKCKTFAQQRKP